MPLGHLTILGMPRKSIGSLILNPNENQFNKTRTNVSIVNADRLIIPISRQFFKLRSKIVAFISEASKFLFCSFNVGVDSCSRLSDCSTDSSELVAARPRSLQKACNADHI